MLREVAIGAILSLFKKKQLFSKLARTLCSFQTASADSEVSESLGSHLQKSFGVDESVKYSESFSPCAAPLFSHIHLTNGFIYWVYMTSCIFLARDRSLICVFFLVWSRAIWVFSHQDKHAATVRPRKLFQGFESVLWSLTVRVTIMHWRKKRKQVMHFFFLPPSYMNHLFISDFLSGMFFLFGPFVFRDSYLEFRHHRNLENTSAWWQMTRTQHSARKKKLKFNLLDKSQSSFLAVCTGPCQAERLLSIIL